MRYRFYCNSTSTGKQTANASGILDLYIGDLHKRGLIKKIIQKKNVSAKLKSSRTKCMSNYRKRDYRLIHSYVQILKGFLIKFLNARLSWSHGSGSWRNWCRRRKSTNRFWGRLSSRGRTTWSSSDWNISLQPWVSYTALLTCSDVI